MKRSKEMFRKSMENLAIFLSWAFRLWTFNSLVGVHFSIRETTNCEKYSAQYLQLLLEEFRQANNSYNDGANGRPVTSRQVTVITSLWLLETAYSSHRKLECFLPQGSRCDAKQDVDMRQWLQNLERNMYFCYMRQISRCKMQVSPFPPCMIAPLTLYVGMHPVNFP